MKVNSKNLYQALHIAPCSFREDWPAHLVHALPTLLCELLNQRFSQSMERLQLVSIGVDTVNPMTSEQGEPLIKNVTLSPKGPQSFVLLGELFLEDTMVLRVAVTFFVRGARKFLRPQEYAFSNGQATPLSAISSENVKSFFEALGQDNAMLYDQDLARLNGRSIPQIPSQMLFVLLVVRSLLVVKKNRVQKLDVTFLRSVQQGQPLQFICEETLDGFFSALVTPDGVAMVLQL